MSLARELAGLTASKHLPNALPSPAPRWSACANTETRLSFPSGQTGRLRLITTVRCVRSLTQATFCRTTAGRGGAGGPERRRKQATHPGRVKPARYPPCFIRIDSTVHRPPPPMQPCRQMIKKNKAGGAGLPAVQSSPASADFLSPVHRTNAPSSNLSAQRQAQGLSRRVSLRGG